MKIRAGFSTATCFARLHRIAALLLLAGAGHAQQTVEMSLTLGPIADYGASPWYTDDIRIGSSQLKLALDNGADFIWATSDECATPACNAHAKADTSQPGFQWLDKTPATRSFGPWGDMTTWTGSVEFDTPAGLLPPLAFFASVDYQGSQFQYLAWDGGIGLPARSDRTTVPSAFFPKALMQAGYISEPVFSQVTNPDAKSGNFILGGVNEAYVSADIVTTLAPKPAPGTDDVWGTELDSLAVGDTVIGSLSGAIFFLDTGSSRFKGDSKYVLPILSALINYKDSSGNAIFEKIVQDGEWVGLAYAAGTPEDYENLPDIAIRLGTDCGNLAGSAAVVTLSSVQYSYQVEVGDRVGQWVVAFRILEQIGGLLVGSTFLDLFYVSYEYNIDDQENYTQGNMLLYAKSPDFGPGPAGYECESPSGVVGPQAGN